MPADQTVQNAVFQIELGQGKIVLRWVVAVFAAVVLALWYTAAEFRGLEKREAQDMAQLARNLARGEGFTTSVIRPISLWHLKTYRADHQPLFDAHPDLANAPLYPLLLSGVFRLAGPKVFQAKLPDQTYAPEQWLIVPFNQLCLFATLLLVYFWAKRLFDLRIAVTASLLLLFSNTLWAYAISGLPTTLLQLLVLSAVYCLYRADARLNGGESPLPADGTAKLWILASAVLLGLCYLTQYGSFFLLIPLAFYVTRILSGRQAWLWAGIYVAIFAAVIAPWCLRNYQISGSILGIARYQIIASDTLYRNSTIDLTTSWYLRSSLSRFMTQLSATWADTWRNIGADLSLFFMVVGLLYGFRRTDTSRLRQVLVLLLMAGIFGLALIGLPGDPGSPTGLPAGNLLVLFLPLVMIYGVAFFYLLFDRIQFQMRLTQLATLSVFVGVNVIPIVFTLLPPARGPYPYPPYCPPYTRLIAHWFDKEEVGFSDAPWSVAWYADRRCVWLPITPEQMTEIHDFVAPQNTHFIFLTPYMLDRHSQSEIVKGEFRPWANIVRGQVPERFPFHSVTLVPPDTDQILFANQPRWQLRPISFVLDTDKGKKSGTNAPPTNAAPAQQKSPAGS